LLADSAIDVSYKVTVQGTTLSASTLAGQLAAAVSSGAFDAALQSSAADNGATGLQTATSDEPTTEVASDSSSSSATLSSGAIIGVAVGGFAFLVLLIAAVVYCTFGRCARSGAEGQNEAPQSQAAAADTTPVAPSAPAEVEVQVATVEPTAVVVAVGVEGGTYAMAPAAAEAYDPKAVARPVVEV
jgi:Na+-transporting methylmalonyl-CoA/oxaloacetate decarboxylase gamma subunit